MNIAILGTGKVGGNLLKKLAGVNHHIFIGTRDIESEKIKQFLELSNVSAHNHYDAVQNSEVVIIAMHPPHIKELLPQIKDILKDKVVIDCSNEVFEKIDPEYASATIAISEIAGVAKIAKAFNTTGAENIIRTQDGEIDTYIAGNEEAKTIAAELATEIGFKAIDTGDISNTHALEEMARIWINVCRRSGNFNAYFKVVGIE